MGRCLLKIVVAVILVFGPGCLLFSQQPAADAGPAIVLQMEPWASLPLVGDGATVLSAGGGARLSAELGLGSLPLFLGLEGSYDISTVNYAGTLVHTVAGGPELGISIELGPRVSFRTLVAAGYYYTMLDDAGTLAGGGSLYATGSLGAHFLLSPSIDLGLSVGYRQLFGLYGGLVASVGTSFALGDTGARVRQIESGKVRATPLGARRPDPDKGVRISDVQLDSVFPVLRNYYDDHPVGYVKLVNQEKVKVTGLSAQLLVKGYMDSPKEIALPAEIAPGAAVTVDLYALLNKSVMHITESEKAPVELTLKYKVRGDDYEDGAVRTITIYGRNNMTWDDTRKAAAFVTRYDPTVQRIARNVGLALAGRTNEVLNRRLLSAIAAHRMTLLAGLQYRVDPTSSYAELSGRQEQVDSLNFPVETIDKLGGDCDDLSILYAAVLEALGVPTAFVTAPGHIYIAFDLGITKDAAAKVFADSSDLFARDGTLWMPIEVTERSRGFLDAWRLAAKEWKNDENTAAFGLYPLADALATYKPVQADEGADARAVPDPAAITAALEKDIAAFRERELSSQLGALMQQDPKKEDPAVQNRIAILLARYGDLEAAEAALTPFTRNTDTAFLPALINLGNVRMLRGKPEEALRLFTAALTREPSSATALAGQARAAYELGRAEDARGAWEKLNSVSPGVAGRIAYVVQEGAGSSRAADATGRGGSIWDE